MWWCTRLAGCCALGGCCSCGFKWYGGRDVGLDIKLKSLAFEASSADFCVGVVGGTEFGGDIVTGEIDDEQGDPLDTGLGLV